MKRSNPEYYYYFKDKHNTLRIRAKRRPSLSTRPRSGTWVVRAYNSETKEWIMPVFPEITWSRLKDFNFEKRELVKPQV